MLLKPTFKVGNREDLWDLRQIMLSQKQMDTTQWKIIWPNKTEVVACSAYVLEWDSQFGDTRNITTVRCKQNELAQKQIEII